MGRRTHRRALTLQTVPGSTCGPFPAGPRLGPRKVRASLAGNGEKGDWPDSADSLGGREAVGYGGVASGVPQRAQRAQRGKGILVFREPSGIDRATRWRAGATTGVAGQRKPRGKRPAQASSPFSLSSLCSLWLSKNGGQGRECCRLPTGLGPSRTSST